MSITGGQVMAAQKLLGWSQARLADRAGVPEGAVNRLELGIDGVAIQRLAALRRSLEDAGVDFPEDEPPG
jgi:transcriptional regulator with XRE-family HTH domain